MGTSTLNGWNMRYKKTDLAWIAGLLEGEGSFGCRSFRSARNVQIRCNMTDEDVVRLLHKKTAVGTFGGPYSSGPSCRKCSDPSKIYRKRYAWNVSGPEAYLLMKELLPLMGKRRSRKIKELVKAYDAVPIKLYRILHLKSGRIEKTTNLKNWLATHNMNESALWRTLSGERRHYRGWRRLA